MLRQQTNTVSKIIKMPGKAITRKTVSDIRKSISLSEE
jgi:hypothetical protein